MRARLFFAVVSLAVFGSIYLYPPVQVSKADTGIVDLCLSTVSAPEGCVFVCPSLDGQILSDRGVVIDVTILDDYGDPIPGIAASDFWVVGCEGNLVLCGGSMCINADGPTDVNGHTTISGLLRAGGYANGLNVVVMGIIIGCPEPICLPITVRSPDMNGDLIVDIVDFALLTVDYTSPPKPYNTQSDFNCDGVVNLIDLAMFAYHYPGHNC